MTIEQAMMLVLYCIVTFLLHAIQYNIERYTIGGCNVCMDQNLVR